jgi:hypothetical protein
MIHFKFGVRSSDINFRATFENIDVYWGVKLIGVEARCEELFFYIPFFLEVVTLGGSSRGEV